MNLLASLDDFIKNSTDTVLPSSEKLALRFGTSRREVQRVLRILALKGVVEIRRGHPARIMSANENTPIPTSLDSAGHLADIIAKQITWGWYRVDEPLPKQLWFAARYHVSPLHD